MEKHNDPVNSPLHYTSGKIEVIEFIEDQKLNFARGSVIKYVSRAGKKWTQSGKSPLEEEIQDLEKASWYVKREIERAKAEFEQRELVRPNDMNPRK